MVDSHRPDTHKQLPGTSDITSYKTWLTRARIYHQTHFLDGAFPIPKAKGPPNANYPFSFVDDMTELCFKDSSHLKDVMTSQYVKDVVGPDGMNFNDFSAANAMLATIERKVYGSSEATDAAVTADYFICGTGTLQNGTEAAKALTPLLIDAVQNMGAEQVQQIYLTESLKDETGIIKYFGAGDPSKPTYTLVYKLCLESQSSFQTVRKIQKAFEAAAGEAIDAETSMILFGVRGLIFDQARGITFDAARQPRL